MRPHHGSVPIGIPWVNVNAGMGQEEAQDVVMAFLAGEVERGHVGNVAPPVDINPGMIMEDPLHLLHFPPP